MERITGKDLRESQKIADSADQITRNGKPDKLMYGKAAKGESKFVGKPFTKDTIIIEDWSHIITESIMDRESLLSYLTGRAKRIGKAIILGTQKSK